MSFRSGFFNSKNHDKQYYASDISKLFDSLINPGVFGNVGNKFIARPGEGMQVIIPSGMAWFNSTWTLNDSDVVINIDEAPYVANYSRIDGIFLQVFPVDDIGTRLNGAYYMKGTETSATPSKPVPAATNGELYIPICYITVANGTTAITASMIENCVGTTECPFITGILETVDVTELLTQWEAQWNDWLSIKNTAYSDFMDTKSASFTDLVNTEETLFTNWFDSVKDDLGEISIGNLKNRVDEITNIYVQDKTLYLPNTAASVTEDGKLVLGTDLQSHIEGGAIEKINVGGVDYDINTFNDIYYQNETLYLPNTGASVTETGVLVIGSGTGNEPGGEVKKINVGGYEYDIVPDDLKNVKSALNNIKSGLVIIPAGNSSTATVTFNEPMPNTSYAVTFGNEVTNTYHHMMPAVTNKTVNGFTVTHYETGGNPGTVESRYMWIAVPYKS